METNMNFTRARLAIFANFATFATFANSATFAIFVATTSIAASAAAQSVSERPRAKAAMWPALHLSESQQNRVKEIHARYAASIKATQQQARDSAARINARELTEVREILDSDQQQTFDSYTTRTKARARRNSGARLMPVRIGISH